MDREHLEWLLDKHLGYLYEAQSAATKIPGWEGDAEVLRRMYERCHAEWLAARTTETEKE